MNKITSLLLIILLLGACGKEKQTPTLRKQTQGKWLTIDSVYASDTKALTETSEGKFFHPVISANGKYLFFTTESYNGLWVKFLNENKIKVLSSARGAGYKFSINDDGTKVFYRLRIKTSRKHRMNFSLIMQDVVSGNINIIATSEKRISPPVFLNGELIYFLGDKVHRKKIEDSAGTLGGNDKWALIHFNGKVYKVLPDTVKELNIGKENIIDIEKSPIGDKIVFTIRGEGIYVGKINGEPHYIDSGQHPSWSPQGNMIVYTKEKSDGMKILHNEIFIATVSPVKIFNLNLKGETPVWHPDDEHIIYSSGNGKILKTKINIVSKR